MLFEIDISFNDVLLPKECPGGCFRGARGDRGGAGLDPDPPIGRQTHPCICSQTLLNRRIFPDNRVNVMAYKYSLPFSPACFVIVEMST